MRYLFQELGCGCMFEPVGFSSSFTSPVVLEVTYFGVGRRVRAFRLRVFKLQTPIGIQRQYDFKVLFDGCRQFLPLS